MSNGELLVTMQAKIKTALEDENLTRTEVLLFELSELFVIYMRDDHPKTQAMWSVFKPMAWAMLVAVTSIIGLIVSGKLSIIVN
jgi:hypothetical protein